MSLKAITGEVKSQDLNDNFSFLKSTFNNIDKGSPKGTYATLSELQTSLPTGDSNIYVVSADGKWYYWDGDTWTAGGIYQSAGIARKSITVSELQPITTGKNLMNPDKLSVGYLNSDGSLNAAATDYRTTDYIPVTDSLPYTAKTVRKLALYDTAKNSLQFVDNSSQSDYTATPSSDGFLRVSFHKDFLNDMQVEQGNTSTGVEPYYNRLVYGKESDTDPLEGKTVLNLGDSIAYGAGSGGVAYADLIAQRNIMTVYDYSQSGATIADYTATDPTRACVQLKLNIFMTENPSIVPDYILLEGGANDMTLTPVGTVTPWDFSEPFTTTEFCGGLETIINTLINNYPAAKIIFVTTHKLWSRTTAAQDSFYPKTIEVLNKWGVPVVDIYKEGRLNTLIDVLKTNYAPDGTHPNEEGYRQFYVPMVEAKMKEV